MILILIGGCGAGWESFALALPLLGANKNRSHLD